MFLFRGFDFVCVFVFVGALGFSCVSFGSRISCLIAWKMEC
jgi:hypothetical protein